jgi:hypothetical protein
MTYVYVIRECEYCEGCTDRFISLDMKKAHDVYLRLTREEIQDTGYHTSHSDSGIYTSRFEINQALLDKEYDYDIDEEGQV